MADNRIAYGLAKKYGIDTTGMNPKEVWEALKEKGVTQEKTRRERRTEEDRKRRDAEKIYGANDTDGFEYPDSFHSAPRLSRHEYAVLRQEVIRQNAEGKGKVKFMNCAFTANYFYIYATQGDDDFTVMCQLDIEANADKINFLMEIFQ